jgi:hypothetical protein
LRKFAAREGDNLAARQGHNFAARDGLIGALRGARTLLALAVLTAALVASLAPAAALADDAYPSADQIKAARTYVKSREGRRAFAVIDSHGDLHGVNVNRRFVTASVVKAMLLVQYLRKVDRADRGLRASERALLRPMIRVSSNEAATAIYRRVGDRGLRRLAKVVGMTNFVIGPSYLRSCRCSSRAWARAQLTAADQARLFYRLDEVVPERFLAYAKNLLETVVAEQSWGIPAAARPLGWRVFFKVGLRSTGLGGLIHQAARLERDGTTIAIAVMTDGDPTYRYGMRTVYGVGARLAGTTGWS